MTDTLVADLKEQLAKRQVVAIVGAEVSIGATKGHAVASWEGLLRHGVERCRGLGRADDGWVRRRLEDIDDGVNEGGDIDSLLGVAEHVTRKLDGPAGGEWRRWLRETVGALQAHRRATGSLPGGVVSVMFRLGERVGVGRRGGGSRGGWPRSSSA